MGSEMCIRDSGVTVALTPSINAAASLRARAVFLADFFFFTTKTVFLFETFEAFARAVVSSLLLLVWGVVEAVAAETRFFDEGTPLRLLLRVPEAITIEQK